MVSAVIAEESTVVFTDVSKAVEPHVPTSEPPFLAENPTETRSSSTLIALSALTVAAESVFVLVIVLFFTSVVTVAFCFSRPQDAPTAAPLETNSTFPVTR